MKSSYKNDLYAEGVLTTIIEIRKIKTKIETLNWILKK